MEQPNKFLNRNYLTLYQAQTVSRLGNQAFIIAMTLWIKQTTQSATLMGMLVMVSSLPGFFLGPVAGILADRKSRKRIIVLSDLLRGLAVLSLALLMWLASEQTNLILVWMFSVAVISAVIGAFFSPAIQASVPDLVPRKNIPSANSLGQASVSLTTFIGQGLGALLFRVLGAQLLFFFNAFSYLYAALSDSFVKIPQQITIEKTQTWQELFAGFWQDFRVGLSFVWRRPGLREMVFVQALLTLFTAPIMILLPFFVEDFLKVKIDWVGYISAGYAVGTMLGFIFAGIIRLRANLQGLVLMGFIVAESAGYGLLGLVTHPAAALVMAVIGGFAGGYVTVHVMSILQATTPSEIRGRVFGLLSTVAISLAPIASGLSGVVADLLDQNIPLIYVSCGLIMGVLALSLTLNADFRQFLRSGPDAGGPDSTGANVPVHGAQEPTAEEPAVLPGG